MHMKVLSPVLFKTYFSLSLEISTNHHTSHLDFGVFALRLADLTRRKEANKLEGAPVSCARRV